MKLIKQNDSAGGLIFKQNTAGKAMKQNYNFGKAFRTKNMLTGDIVLDSSDILNKDITVLFRYRDTGAGYHSQFIMYSGESYNTQSISARSAGTNLSFVKYTDGVKTSSGEAGNRVKLSANNAHCFVFAATDIPNYAGDVKLRLATGYHYLYFSGNNIINYAGRDAVLQHIAVFDRELDASEITYYYNNGLGNELLNTSGLLAEIEVSAGAIVEDNIVLSDKSGNNRNMIIVGLPAGTLEDQLAYFNSNHIVSW